MNYKLVLTSFLPFFPDTLPLSSLNLSPLGYEHYTDYKSWSVDVTTENKKTRNRLFLNISHQESKMTQYCSLKKHNFTSSYLQTLPGLNKWYQQMWEETSLRLQNVPMWQFSIQTTNFLLSLGGYWFGFTKKYCFIF